MKDPLISVIIPTYNAQSTIQEAIGSVLCQSFRNLEILVIDGLSTDGTVSLVENVARNDERITLVSEKDNGIYDAMNKGITISNGKWLYFMGSDDKVYDENVFASLFEDNSIDQYHVIYGNVYSNHFNGVYDGEFNQKKLWEKNICHQAIIIKKEVFAITGKFDTRYRAHADWDHNLKWFLNSQINRKFVNIIIAEYGEGGYSSRNADVKFSSEKESNILKYGIKTLDKDLRVLLYQSIANERKKRKDYGGYLKYKLRSYLTVYA